ncbi:hypothetical protein RJ639_002011, partial [Escallonia herrerae]
MSAAVSFDMLWYELSLIGSYAPVWLHPVRGHLHSKMGEPLVETVLDYDRVRELEAFDGTKAGVKGLVDAGRNDIPQIFIRPKDELAEELNSSRAPLQVPAIDLSGIERIGRRNEIVDEIRHASEKWGFFQVVNHEVPVSLLDEMIDAIRMFHEQDLEVKKEFYSRDLNKQVRYNCNFDLYQSRTANWRDTITISMLKNNHLDPNEVPAVC